MKAADQSAESGRTLVREVLFAQLAFAAVVGFIALGCVWWVANWVVRDNLDDWAARWIGEMESLGAGLYVEHTNQRFLELENYLARFPEILYVRYYDADGDIIYVEHREDDERTYPALTPNDLGLLAQAADDTESHLMDVRQDPIVRISQAVVTETIAMATDLFNAESLDELETTISIVGYVELGLDYGRYDRNMLGSIATGSAFVILAFLALTLAGRIALRRAVQPLVNIQKPLNQIAEGNLDIEVPHSPHYEIAALGRALETAVARIRERDQHLRRLANFDTLTGLPNRHHLSELLEERLTKIASEKRSGALLFLDLDQFKYVNDSFGHEAGDAVLTQIAERLRQTVRKGDLIARYSGDEFIMFISDVSAERADGIARKLMQDLREYPLAWGDLSFNVSCSVGITMAPYPRVYTPEELISQADLACRQAKSRGRNRTALFTEDAELDSIRNDLGWHQRLEQALKHDEFVLHYQPIMSLADDGTTHFEVLVRLEEDGELRYPEAFLSAAVRFGLMQEVDHWVIAKALSELSDVRQQQPDIRFSINVTGSSFADGTLATFIAEQLALNDLPASAIVLEITEQVAIGSISDAVPQILKLIELGCEFAVDDFGTGYSSLSYLKRLPVQYIKIDGAFIQRLTVNRADQTIVRAIADIARIMGKRTIAEFVGDAETLQLIREMGIDFAQGYHVGKPGPVPGHIASSEDRVVRIRPRRKRG